MTVAAITEKYTEQQLTTFFPGEGIEWRLSPTIQAVDVADIYIDLDFVNERNRREALSRLSPALIIVNAVTPTIKEMGIPFVRINAWPGFLERNIHELAVPDEESAGRVATLYQ